MKWLKCQLPECEVRFVPQHYQQVYCCLAHQKRANQRAAYKRKKEERNNVSQPNISEILEKHGERVSLTASKYRNGQLSEKELPEHQQINYNVTEQAINQLVYTQVLELIGEDEHKTKEYPVMKGSIDPSPTGTLPMSIYDPDLVSRNNLRAELRNKAKAKYIGDSE